MSFQAPLKKSPTLTPLATPSTASPKKLQPSTQNSPADSKTPTGLTDSSEIIKSVSTRIDLGGGNRDAVAQKDIPSPTARIDIDSMDMGSLVKRSEESALSRKERLLSAQEKHPRSMTGRGELTLSGEMQSIEAFFCMKLSSFVDK
jgi:hypothetical protein